MTTAQKDPKLVGLVANWSTRGWNAVWRHPDGHITRSHMNDEQVLAMGKVPPLTKTRAREEALAHLRFGYFATSASEAWVTCPRKPCTTRVVGVHKAWEKPRASLQAALIAHLLEEHGKEGIR